MYREHLRAAVGAGDLATTPTSFAQSKEKQPVLEGGKSEKKEGQTPLESLKGGKEGAFLLQTVLLARDNTSQGTR